MSCLFLKLGYNYLVVVRGETRNANHGSRRDERSVRKGEVFHNLAGHDN
jgi:hypothetical protein